MGQFTPPVTAYIGLGSNLNGPRRQIQQAVQRLSKLPHSRISKKSSLYRSKAVGPGDQPDYINSVIALRTELEPTALLDLLQQIENSQHRTRTIRWGARTLDLDILLYGDLTIANERLTIPHPQLQHRNFVLYPLAEIEPELCLPNGTAVQKILDNLPEGDSNLWRIPAQNTDCTESLSPRT